MGLEENIDGHLTNIAGLQEQLVSSQNDFLGFLSKNLKGKVIIVENKLKGIVVDISQQDSAFFLLIKWTNPKRGGQSFISIADQFTIEE